MAELSERLAYLNLCEEDIERLARLRPALEANADEFVEAFYRHLLGFPALAALLGDEGVRERLIEQQRAYLLSLAGPRVDDDYVARRKGIGALHYQLGLESRWYLGAYALYNSMIVPLICEQYRDDPREGERTVLALQKLLVFDGQLAIETYIERREQELERLNRQLSESQRELARDLEERRMELRDTMARAHAAEELASIATLVAGLAHEIGTPMGVIQGHAKMLEGEVDSDEGRWRLTTIQEQIGRISGIIQALLNMARPGRSVRSPVSLEAILDTTLAFVTEKLRRRNVEVVREYEGIPSVLGDPERLQQVFLNLVLNAADSMPDGGRLSVRVEQPEARWVTVCVIDTGTGIPERDLERVFEPFFTSKPAGKGSGLGLAVTRGIVNDHGGSIEVQSRVGEGTEFCVRLPVEGEGGGSGI